MIIRLLALIGCLLFACGCKDAPRTPSGIVSMAPNVTEILYALGLSNRIVGVSNYSDYPPAAQKKPRVGGTYDPNWEAIVALQPQLVIGLESQREIAEQLDHLGIEFIGVPHERIAEIIDSIRIIGAACGAQKPAGQLVARLESNVHFKRAKRAGTPKRIIVCIGHDAPRTRLYIAARNTFYDDLIQLAGGVNACEQTVVKYPEVTPEGLQAMHPDQIIDLHPKAPTPPVWNDPRVTILTNDYAVIPGPRFDQLLADFKQIIVPEPAAELNGTERPNK